MSMKLLYLSALIFIFCFSRFPTPTGQAQLVMPVVYASDTMLSNQLHIDLVPSFNPIFMTDTAYYMTCRFEGGITQLWIKSEVWLYGRDYKNPTRVDRGGMSYTITGVDLSNVWVYRIPYFYYKVDSILNLTPKP